MVKIQITKRNDIYGYRYSVNKEDNKVIYVSKSGFKTLEEARIAAKKSYNRHIKNYPTHVTKTKHTKEKQSKSIKIKNLKITDGGYRLVETAVFGIVTIVAVFGGTKLVLDMKDRLSIASDNKIEEQDNTIKELITSSDCDFSNVHIIIRTAQNETRGVGTVTADMLTRLGASNEIVNKDSDLSSRVSRAISNYPDKDIVIINLERGLENSKSDNTIIIGDCSNRREYPSDVLVACINASLNDYSLDPIIKSGVSTGIWRTQSYIEKELNDSTLINNVSQLTIDLPILVGEDQITRNDAAASIVEGIMRWTTLDTSLRYKDIYYTTEYGDTMVSIMRDHGVSLKDIEENSDIDMHKDARVGNTILVAPLPKVATSDVIVYNPYITIDPSQIEPIVITYIVQSGDTVSDIANMYGVKIEDIVVPSGNSNNIYIGETLYITTYNLYETHSKTNIKKI